MRRHLTSLLAGRNRAPLNDDEIARATNTFLGMDTTVNTRYEADRATAFHVVSQQGQTYGEILFGPDLYPGTSNVDPNAALSLDAAAAHELTHYHRWRNKAAIDQLDLLHIDEALTSLQAILRYDRHLNEHDIRQLVQDAIQRLQLYVATLTP